MELQNILKLLVVGLVALAIGGIVGYEYAPDKVKTVEKIVEKTVKEKETKVTKEYDPNTGKVTKETTETKDKETNIESHDKTTEKTKDQKHYAIKGGIVVDPRNLSDKPLARVGGEVKLPVLPVFLGVEGDLNVNRPLVGVYLRMEF